MERDFLGLSSKETLAVVKEEINNDGFKDPGIFFLYDFSFLFLALLLIFVYLLIDLLRSLTYYCHLESLNFCLNYGCLCIFIIVGNL